VYGFDCLYWRSLKVAPIASVVAVLAEVVSGMAKYPGSVFVMALEVEGRDEVLCAACLAKYGAFLIFSVSESASAKAYRGVVCLGSTFCEENVVRRKKWGLASSTSVILASAARERLWICTISLALVYSYASCITDVFPSLIKARALACVRIWKCRRHNRIWGILTMH
jgi:hypothetical protein